MNSLLKIKLNKIIFDENNEPTVENYSNWYIKRIKRKNLSNYLELQDDLLYNWLENNLSVGSIISSEKGWELIKNIASLIPVFSKEGETTLDIEKLADEDEDYLNNITRLFFTKSVDDDDFNDLQTPYKPSLIAEFNQLNHGDSLGKAVEKISNVTKEKQK